MQLYQRKKKCFLSEMKMKHLNSQVKEGRKHLKASHGAKANQLNHYVIPMLDKFDYDWYQRHSSKQRYISTERTSEHSL